MTFIVNGANWQFDDASSDAVAQALDRFCEFARVSNERGETFMLGDDFHFRPMRGQLTLWDLFSAEARLGLSGELRQELAIWLGPAQYYVDDEDWPDGADETVVSIGVEPAAENVDVAWAHHCIRAGRIAACFTIREAAVMETTTASGVASVHFVSDGGSRKRFWQEVIALQGDDAASLRRYAAHAFPDLFLVEGVLAHLERLGGGYHAARERVRSALSVLDDRGHWIFTNPPPAFTPEEKLPASGERMPSNQLVIGRFARCGLDVAPENPNVYLNRVCREARETTLGQRTLYCEWHVKLEPHRNRIHIHAPVPQSGGKLVIGMVAEHLPLPG